jgi:hypothetical protein
MTNTTASSDNRWTPTVIASFLGVLIGTVTTIGTQYWITFKGIEQPKIELEMKKVELESRKAEIDLKKSAIEAHKQASALTPNVSVTCNAENIDAWTWKVACNSKNNGVYHSDITLNSAQISLANDISEKLYTSGQGFDIEYPNNKQSFRATPGASGDLWFYVKFKKSLYKSGLYSANMIARIDFKFTTIVSATTYFLAQFPELKDAISQIGNGGYTIMTALPAARQSE